ncbi:MAG: hypothetical protein A2X49_03300 [Lentisphaerae bacterium GWF2_52_8]|nr:MAG: hypothetical protein A2X49_03300 [Lentisphaerae bacterium GWF2_52_8]
MSRTKVSINDLDKIIHEPARLVMCGILNEFEEVEFKFLLSTTGLSTGNLVTHLRKMEDAGYLNVKKEFKDRKPCTSYCFTELGLNAYRQHIKNLKNLIG